MELAVKALKNGAADFLLKPWDNQTLIDKVTEAYRSRKAPERTAKVDRAEGFEMLVGRSPAMLQLMKVVSKVARTDANILITGENGTGKEILAREIHRLSPRGARPMLNVDMGAISESLFESELFGHERGAFTDAHESRPGKFEAANGSSLFMDELGNLPLPLQTKLRINTIHLELPPLRERGDDILLFIDCFLRKFTSKYQRQEIRIHEQTVEKLRSYHWPGNIRELQHTIEKAVILCEGSVIRPKDILVKQTWQPQATATVPNLEEVERRAIETAILQNNGNLTAAAEQLGVSRQTLYNKLKRFKL